MSRPYLTTLALVTAHPKPADWWKARNLVPAVSLAAPDLYHADAALEPTALVLGALAPPGWLWEAGCYRPDLPGPLTALPAAAWTVFLRNVARLGALLKAHGGGGLLIDCEYYPATGGGPMPPGTWKAPGAEARGAACARALGAGLTIAFMAWAPELKRQPGLAAFARGAWKVSGPSRSVFLSEDYVGGADPQAAKALGAGLVRSGVWLKKAKVPAAVGWAWDPAGVLLEG